jgi:dihydroorotate dehydrogenase (fumarate)
MIDLSAPYMGLTLRTPLVASAGPLQKDIANVLKLEDAGISAIVLHSLFEEQIEVESLHLDRFLSGGADSYAESLSYLPDMRSYNIGPDAYLEHIRRAKASVDIPIIASLNGISLGGWIEHAKLIEQAGADALELNLYDLPTDPAISGAEVEQRLEDLVRHMKACIRIPLAVKLSPFFSSIPNVCKRLDEAGADALVLFNRFYQPDYDIEALEAFPNLKLSDPSELLLRIHWVGLLFGRVRCDLAITGGVHSHVDVIKAMMAGASVAMMTSVLLMKGMEVVGKIEQELVEWLEEHEYESVQQMRGSMSYRAVPDKSVFERANYMRVLSSYALRS